MDLVRGMIASDKRMREEHIAFILREVIKVSRLGNSATIISLVGDIAEMRIHGT